MTFGLNYSDSLHGWKKCSSHTKYLHPEKLAFHFIQAEKKASFVWQKAQPFEFCFLCKFSSFLGIPRIFSPETSGISCTCEEIQCLSILRRKKLMSFQSRYLITNFITVHSFIVKNITKILVKYQAFVHGQTLNMLVNVV